MKDTLYRTYITCVQLIFVVILCISILNKDIDGHSHSHGGPINFFAWQIAMIMYTIVLATVKEVLLPAPFRYDVIINV